MKFIATIFGLLLSFNVSLAQKPQADCLFGRRRQGPDYSQLMQQQINLLTQIVQQNGQMLAMLERQQQVPQAPPAQRDPIVVYLTPPLQNIPLGGPPLQQIPIGGPPLQQIPIGGPPLQQVPIGGPPQQQIPIGNGPLQQIGQGQPPLQQIPQAPQAPLLPKGNPQPQGPQQQIPIGKPPGQSGYQSYSRYYLASNQPDQSMWHAKRP